MSQPERRACCSPAWRFVTTRAVVPWLFAGTDLAGELLEIGSGAGFNAGALLARYPQVRVTATDVDPAMLDTARRTLGPFGDRVAVEQADAAALGFADASFDTVVSLLMLHHVGDLSPVLAELARVLRPGGRLIGYDLTRRLPRWHRHGPSGHAPASHAPATPEELGASLAGAGFTGVRLRSALAGLVVRFSATR